ncbi:hypothetical protein BZG36_01150 [Bifiguratus adelaidae]|uniref:protein disulfide-isomerase n=1 Tax=Bifiguratus adelaidae TaxID=1938954 RepID=A0A261Y5T1_9FUNG|nr:hypothetical protein BZG36_01150 [Bifiguratus adelaidae]
MHWVQVGFGALLLVLQAIQPTLALYSKSDSVLLVNSPQDWKRHVVDTQKLVAVEFFAPWCGHCQRLAPAWKKAAQNLKGLVNVVGVDCDDEANKPLCGYHGIQGFPTIKVFPPELKPDKKTPGLSAKRGQGPREAKPIVDHLLSMMPSKVQFVKTEVKPGASKRVVSLDDFLGTKVLSFTTKPTTAPLYKALSTSFSPSHVIFGEVKDTEASILDHFGIDASKLPQVLLLKPDGNTETFEGKLGYESLKTWIEENVGAESEPKVEAKKSAGGTKKEKNPFDPKVTRVSTLKELQTACTRNALCAIAVLPTSDPSQEVETENVVSISLLQEVKKMAYEKNNGAESMVFAWMDAAIANPIIDKFNLVTGDPALVALSMAKKRFRPYIGVWDKESVGNWLENVKTGRVGLWEYDGEIALGSPVKDEL